MSSQFNRLLCFLACLSFGPISEAQIPANSASSKETFLRIANLLPIQTPLVDLYRGADPYLLGMKAGFLRTYLSVPPSGGDRFTLKQAGAVIGTFRLPNASGGAFYTLAVYQDRGKAPSFALVNDALPKKKPTPEDPNPAPPLPHLHLYVGGFGFPVTVSAKGLGPWQVNEKTLIADVEITGPPPPIVQIDYVDRYGEAISLNFPTDYKAASSYSAFVTQRAIKRPRLLAYPDNIDPSADLPPLIAPEPASNPGPTASPTP